MNRKNVIKIILGCLFVESVATPPAPPALPTNLANQTVQQLLQLFSTSTGVTSSNVSLLATTQRLIALNQQAAAGGSTQAAVTGTSQSVAATNILSTVPATSSNSQAASISSSTTGGSAGALLSALQNPTMSMQQKAVIMGSSTTNPDGTAKKITASNKSTMPAGVQALSKTFGSDFTGSNSLQLPNITFTNSSVTAAYKNFVQALAQCPSFLPMFKTIHITALHELYLYIMGIYATLNLLNLNDLKTYIILEQSFGLNKKTLILSHLIDLIEAQLRQTVQGVMPGMPDQVAVQAGTSCIKNQGGNNLNMLVLDMEQTVLSLLGMDPLTQDQVAAIVAALTTSANVALIQANTAINQTSYKNALAVMSPSNANFVSQLTADETEALTQALNTLSLGTTSAQAIQTVENIIALLNTPTTAPALSATDAQQFMKYINQITFGLPAGQILAATQALAQSINGSTTTPLGQAEFAELKSMLAYICILIENQLKVLLTQAIIMLGNANPQNVVLSISQEVYLQNVTSRLLAQQQPTQLTTLNTNDLTLLTSAFSVFSQNPPSDLTEYSTTFSTINSLIATSILSTSSFTPSETAAYTAALDYLSTFTLTPSTLAQAEQEFSPTEQQALMQAFTAVSSSAFTSFASFDVPTQQLMLAALQKFDQIIETRAKLEAIDAAPLLGLFGQNQSVSATLLTSLSLTDYLALSSLYDYLQTASASTLSASALSSTFANQNPDPYVTLQKCLSPGTTSQYSYIDFLNMAYQQTSSTVTQQVVQSLTAAQLAIYQAIAQIVNQQNFQFSMFTQPQVQQMLSFFTPLQASLQKSAQAQPASSTSSTNTLLQNTAALIFATASFNTMKATFLWTLKQYLLFFNAYTASLQQCTQNAYQLINGFVQQAQLVSQTLSQSLVQTLNPPLFFYDATSMRHLTMLPQLATLVETTTAVPYPTYCVEQALNGSTVNPYDGVTYTNQVSIGPSFSYEKFFFLDSTQQSQTSSSSSTALPELTGQAAQNISWLQKVSVPVSATQIQTSSGSYITNYNHIYVTQNKPNDMSGFYMNIPTFVSDPSNPNTILVRLFEQEIIAQPAWLNNSGLTQNSSETVTPGVMTVVRGIMGDFLSVVNLGIFDPCLTFIFKSAMQATNSTTLPAPDPTLATAAQQCMTYLQEQAAQNQIMQQVATVSASSAQAFTSNYTQGALNAGN